jgi:membrane associated rhomboid family serine protease
VIALNVLAFVLWQPTFATGRDGEIRQIAFFYCRAMVPWEVTHQVSLARGGAQAREAIDRQAPLGQGVSGAELQEFLRERCPDKSWWQSIFVAMFLHGGWLHIGGNMLFLWVFGNNVEDKLRPLWFILFYLAAGLAATAAQVAVDADAVVPNLGASGAIAGVLGAYAVMFPRRRVLTLVIFLFITTVYLPAYLVLGLWFVFQLFSGFGSLVEPIRAGGGGVAYFAHIGGFVFGSVMALLFFPKERVGLRPPPPRPDLRWGWRGGYRRRRPPDDWI